MHQGEGRSEGAKTLTSRALNLSKLPNWNLGETLFLPLVLNLLVATIQGGPARFTWVHFASNFVIIRPIVWSQCIVIAHLAPLLCPDQTSSGIIPRKS